MKTQSIHPNAKKHGFQLCVSGGFSRPAVWTQVAWDQFTEASTLWPRVSRQPGHHGWLSPVAVPCLPHVGNPVQKCYIFTTHDLQHMLVGICLRSLFFFITPRSNTSEGKANTCPTSTSDYAGLCKDTEPWYSSHPRWDSSPSPATDTADLRRRSNCIWQSMTWNQIFVFPVRSSKRYTPPRCHHICSMWTPKQPLDNIWFA